MTVVSDQYRHLTAAFGNLVAIMLGSEIWISRSSSKGGQNGGKSLNRTRTAGVFP